MIKAASHPQLKAAFAQLRDAIETHVQRLEHHEMAGYGCVRTYARQLGSAQQADMQTTLNEEGDADNC